MKTKQIRVSDAVIKTLDDLAEEYDIDRKSLVNVSLVIMKWALENKANTIEITDAEGVKKSMIIPLIVGKK